MSWELVVHYCARIDKHWRINIPTRLEPLLTGEYCYFFTDVAERPLQLAFCAKNTVRTETQAVHSKITRDGNKVRITIPKEVVRQLALKSEYAGQRYQLDIERIDNGLDDVWTLFVLDFNQLCE